MQKLYRYDPVTFRYLGYVTLLDGCTLADPENYTTTAPADESRLAGYQWDAANKAWTEVAEAPVSTDTTTTTTGES
jgi:hypothetical protein